MAETGQRVWPGKFLHLSAAVSPSTQQEALPTSALYNQVASCAEGIVDAQGTKERRTRGSQLSSEVCAGLGFQEKAEVGGRASSLEAPSGGGASSSADPEGEALGLRAQD